MRRGVRAGLAALAMLCACAASRSALAASGGEDVYGYSWIDPIDGCPNTVPAFGSGVTDLYRQTGIVGPIPLGFTMRYYEYNVSQVWISATGYVTFSSPGGVPTATQSLPSPTVPSDLVAAHWAPSVVESTIRYQATTDSFHVQWLQRLDSTITSRWLTDLVLNADGSMQMRWFPPQRFDGVTVGYEDRTGSRGRTIWRNGVGENAWDGPPLVRSLCILRPARLDCTRATVATCGATLPLVTDPAGIPSASIWSCAAGVYQGIEHVVRLDVAQASTLTASISSSDLDLFEILNPPCRELDCVAFGDTTVTHRLALPGSYWFVVDRLASGGGARFDFTSSCTSVYEPLACGRSVSATTAGLSNEISTHGCAWRRLDGGERFYLVDVPAPQSVLATLDGRTPDLWVAIYSKDEFETAGDCLDAGRGGAALPMAAPGQYVVVVDGELRAGGPFTLDLRCGVTPDCSSVPRVSCLSQVDGDTTGAPNALISYSCLRDALVGPERIYQFNNPTEQTVTARFLSSQPGQRLILLSSCGLAQCVLGDAAGFSAPRLPRGDYFMVVDGLLDSEGPFEFEIACSQVRAGIDLRAAGVDLVGSGTTCESRTISGDARVVVANLGTDPAPAPVEVVVFQDVPPKDGVYSASDVFLGRGTLLADVPAGASLPVSVPVSGDVLFRDAPLSAEVDTRDAVAEAVETNNGFDSGSLCEFHPPIGVFSPTVEWRWTTSTTLPTYAQVDTTPMVADLDGDGSPEVVVVTGADPAGFSDGVVRVLRGTDGSEIWTADQPEAMVYSSSNLAIGDLDGDGALEIVAHSWAATGTPRGSQLVCLESDGTVRWISQDFIDHPVVFEGGGGASIADLDCDGRPEIVYGKNAFKADGTYFWAPEPGGGIGVNEDGRNLDGALSVVVDVDGDGIQEVVAGPTCYELDTSRRHPTYNVPYGRIKWDAPFVPDGFPAVGQFDGDDAPEIALTASGSVFLLEGDTGAVRWECYLPLGGGGCLPDEVMGGPPTVADFDGDFAPEIGVAGADWYVVVETDGQIKWQAPIVDCSSHRTASSVFDFDGDGAAEVAFMDETRLHVYRGRDGWQLASLATSSHTWQEMITIADVDADGNAEVIVPLNSSRPTGPKGVEVVGDVDDNWVSTRTTWNQHAYHIDNVKDDGKIPGPGDGCERPSWSEHGTYRDQLGSAVYTAPDLTVMLLSVTVFEAGDCDHFARVTCRVGNAGGVPGGFGARMQFYDDDPARGGSVLTSATIPQLGAGDWWDAAIDVPLPRVGFVDIYVTVDDDGAGRGVVEECREDNNACALVVDNPPFPDPPPARVGDALRATWHGSAYATWCTGAFNWELDEGMPRPPGDHYHVMRSADPRFLTIVPGMEPWPSRSYMDATPQTPDDLLPHCWFIQIYAADTCDQLEAP